MNAECNNTAGSYTCRPCFPGFIPGNFTTCSELHDTRTSLQYIIIIKHCTSLTVCTNGNIRLMNGTEPSVREGRVEICFNNVYGSICDDFWDVVDASVVCKQLGFNGSEGNHINEAIEIF